MLGRHRFDITHQAVVVGRVDAAGDDPRARARALCASRPDAVMVTASSGEDRTLLPPVVETIRAEADIPVAVRTADAGAVAASLAAGAVAGHDPSGLSDPDYLVTVRRADASLIVGSPASPPLDVGARTEDLLRLATRAVDAGIAAHQVVIDVDRAGSGLPPSAASLLDELQAVARHGWAALAWVVSPGGPDGRADVDAAQAALVPRGARFLVTDDVRSTRRIASVAAELLRARDAAGDPT
jgi:hypothetical protein